MPSEAPDLVGTLGPFEQVVARPAVQRAAGVVGHRAVAVRAQDVVAGAALDASSPPLPSRRFGPPSPTRRSARRVADDVLDAEQKVLAGDAVVAVGVEDRREGAAGVGAQQVAAGAAVERRGRRAREAAERDVVVAGAAGDRRGPVQDVIARTAVDRAAPGDAVVAAAAGERRRGAAALDLVALRPAGDSAGVALLTLNTSALASEKSSQRSSPPCPSLPLKAGATVTFTGRLDVKR